MPWCPVCKTEYREGITTCSDCGATLVEELTSDYDDFKEVAFIENDILAKKFIDYLEYSKIEAKSEPDADGTAFHILVHPDDVKKAKTEFLAFRQVEKDRMDRLISGLIEGDNAAADDSDGEEASAADYEIESIENANGLTEEEKEQLILKATADAAYKPAGVYVKKADTAREMSSTAYTFIGFAVLLLVFSVLNILGVIRMFYNNIPGNIIILAMAFCCSLIGINAIKRSKKAASEVADEEAFISTLNEWMEQNIDVMTATDAPVDENGDGVIDESETANAESVELMYLNRTAAMKEAVTKQFGELDEDFLDSIIDEFYDKHFN